MRIEEQLRSGQPLSVVMTDHPNIFPSLVVNMIRAGEASGSIDETLERLADHFEKVHRTRQKLFLL